MFSFLLKPVVANRNEESDEEMREERNRLVHPPPQSRMDGRKRAVFVGINYRETEQELRGCINDVANISDFIFSKWGFSAREAMILTDDTGRNLPTKANILKAMDWLVDGAADGDSLMWHFSGHGHQVEDKSGDEEDGMDEVLVPLDFREAGLITDDEIFTRLVSPLPRGVRLTIFMDCCHSGSIVDLPYTYQSSHGSPELLISEENKRKTILDALWKAVNDGGLEDKSLQHVLELCGPELKIGRRNDAASRRKHKETNGQVKLNNENKAEADVVMFSGCQDHQTSADAVIDAKATGAMSHVMVRAYKQLEERDGKPPSYSHVLLHMRELLNEGNYSQVPQMSTSRLFDLDAEFRM